jgi:hypothetical protein
MAKLPEEFDFLADDNLDNESKRLLLAGLFEDRRYQREAAQKAEETKESLNFERKKFWHNTPLMLALVGTISVFANGLVAYVMAARTASDTVTLEQLKSQLKDSEERSRSERERQLTELKQQLAQQSADAEAKRSATKDERDFEFRIMERELAKTDVPVERANVLLFLVRVGVITTLKRVELEKIALEECAKAHRSSCEVGGIPPTIGSRPDLPLVGIDQINFDKVVLIGELSADEGTEVKQTGSRPVSVLERPGVLLRRLEGKAVMASFTRPNGTTVWIKPTAVSLVREVSPGFMAPNVKTTLQLTEGSVQGVDEDPLTVVDRLGASTSMAKLTSPDDKPIWVKSDLTRVIGDVPPGTPGAAILEVDGRRISVKQSVAAAETILKDVKH